VIEREKAEFKSYWKYK